MKQRRRDQQTDAGQHQDQADTVDVAAGHRDIGKQLLECGLELESKQHLRSQDQEPRFVECGLQAAVYVHWASSIELSVVSRVPIARLHQAGLQERNLPSPVDRTQDKAMK